MATEKFFVIGPATRIDDGIVGEADARKWREYLQREGQPFLNAPAEVRSILRAKRLIPPTDRSADIEFRFEHLDPEFVENEPDGELNWRNYFRDVHHIEADSPEELVRALEAAGWPEDRIARYREIQLDDELPSGSAEEDEYFRFVPDDLPKEEPVEEARPLIGPLEWAWGMFRELTDSFQEKRPNDQMLGKLRLDPEDGGLRTAYAIGELTVTAVQELLNSAETGVRVEFADPPEWRSVNHPLLMESRNAEIARAVADRFGLSGRARDHAMGRIMRPWESIPCGTGEHLADVHWAHEQAGFETGGRFWLDLNRKSLLEFIEECRRFTFDDCYDHCPESQRIYQKTPGYGAYHLWLFQIDLDAWNLRPLTETNYAQMQATPHSLERWIAGFTEPQPSPERIAYLTRQFCRTSGLLSPDEPFRMVGS